MIDLDRLPYISNYKRLLYHFIMCIIRIISLTVIQSLKGKEYYFYEYYYFIVSFDRKCLKNARNLHCAIFWFNWTIGYAVFWKNVAINNLDRNKKFWKRWIVFRYESPNWKTYTYISWTTEMAEWYTCNLCEQTGTSWQLVANFCTVIGGQRRIIFTLYKPL